MPCTRGTGALGAGTMRGATVAGDVGFPVRGVGRVTVAGDTVAAVLPGPLRGGVIQPMHLTPPKRRELVVLPRTLAASACRRDPRLVHSRSSQ